MTQLYVTPMVAWDECSQWLGVYQFDTEYEHDMFKELSHDEQLEYLGLDPLENHY